MVSVGAAGPVKDGPNGKVCSMTHLNCHIDENALTYITGSKAFLCNDMPPMLAGADIVRASEPDSTFEINKGLGISTSGARIVVAAGSGLGYGHSLSNGEIELIGPSEGGHDPFAQSSFKLASEIEELLLHYMQDKYTNGDQITQEMVLRGNAIQDILDFLIELTNHRTDFRVTEDTPLLIYELIKERNLPDSVRDRLAQTDIDRSAVISEAAESGESIHCVVADAMWKRLLGLYVGHKLQTDMPTRGAFLGGTPVNKAGIKLASVDERFEPFTFMHGLRTREDKRFANLVAEFPIYGQKNDDAFPVGLARLALSKYGMIANTSGYSVDNIPITVV